MCKVVVSTTHKNDNHDDSSALLYVAGRKNATGWAARTVTTRNKKTRRFLCDFKRGQITEKSLNNRVRLDGPQVDK
jgi:hypothetical protein